jgi:benzoyl-CoA reductase subunit D
VLTAGVDVGSASVKVAVLRHGSGEPHVLTLDSERYRKRSPQAVVERAFSRALAATHLTAGDIDYIATTGEGELAPKRHGHFYGMTTHARGALFLEPRARSVLDIGALHARAMRVDANGRVLSYRMTSQCASGTGQFLENIARYLGVAIEDAGPLSLRAEKSEAVSSICAVLAETDVINMVARGIPAATIFRGIHEAVAGRLAKLLRHCRAETPVIVTGGMAANEGLLEALRQRLTADGQPLEVLAPKNPEFAGALGAALWGAYRATKLDPRTLAASSGKETSHVAL